MAAADPTDTDDMHSAPDADRSRPASRAAARRLPAALICAALCAALAAACAGGGPARLLAADFRGAATLLQIVEPGDPSAEGRRLAVIEHAEGWAPVGAISPDGRAVALLVLPPGRARPRAQTTLEVLTPDSRVRIADGLDLAGGAVWADDGDRLLVRAERGGGHELLVLDSRTGRPLASHRPGAGRAVYPLALSGDAAWAVEARADGDRLAEWDISEDPWRRTREIGTGSAATRDWAISPDRRALAFIDGRGGAFELRVLPWRAGDRAYEIATTAGDRRTFDSPDDRLANAAAPVWTGDDGLIVGTWPGAPGGFALPIARDAGTGRTAVRWFSGAGPGDPGDESAAVIGADGEASIADDPRRRLIGWWRG